MLQIPPTNYHFLAAQQEPYKKASLLTKKWLSFLERKSGKLTISRKITRQKEQEDCAEKQERRQERGTKGQPWDYRLGRRHQISLASLWGPTFHEQCKNPRKTHTSIVLNLDGHGGQMKNLEAIDLARENALLAAAYKPSSLFAALRCDLLPVLETGIPQGSYYMAAEQPGRAVTAYQVVHLLNESCMQAGHKWHHHNSN